MKNTIDKAPLMLLAMLMQGPGSGNTPNSWDDDDDDEVFDDLMAVNDDMQQLKDKGLIGSAYSEEDDDHLPDDDLQ